MAKLNWHKRNYLRLYELGPGAVWDAKKFQWMMKKKDNHYEVFKRQTDLDEWDYTGRFVVVDGIPFTDFTDVEDRESGKQYKNLW